MFIMAVNWFNVYNIIGGVLMVLMVLLSVAMIIIVMMQQGTNSNLGAVSGNTDSFFGKHRSNTLESKFKRITIYVAAAILVNSILYFVIALLKNSL